ncbi:TetR/AcrR family transcriptional regulator [Teredinibacter haidensis]|uniref:TetR/AcrR family transcriptional regulator n=1 Tax=Teredinibacter haidensis TaxID=2731755 RepID=UPI000949042B|nr:TetR/AcrR family transcriptional regulator [Teredinibacter haidensis]
MSSQETRTRLLETALDLIWQSSYNSVGVNEICKHAGVTKGSFYHHFESKAALFCEASEYSWQSTKKEVDEIMSPQNPPLEQLKLYLRFIFVHKFGEAKGTAGGCSYTSSVVHLGCDDESIAETQRSMLNKAIVYNAALIRTLQANGFLEAVGDEVRVARLFSQYIHGIVSFARVDNDFSIIKGDMAEGSFRILGLKREYWFNPFD